MTLGELWTKIKDRVTYANLVSNDEDEDLVYCYSGPESKGGLYLSGIETVWRFDLDQTIEIQGHEVIVHNDDRRQYRLTFHTAQAIDPAA
jgi:hypothetical protein